MDIKNAFEIIENNIDSADFCGPISPDIVDKSEKMLGVIFPSSYRKFLERYGAGDIAGIELFGIIKDPTIDGHMIPNGIWLTQNLREGSTLPESFVAVSETGYGAYYVLDTSQKNFEDESPVYIWDSTGQKEKVADHFGQFLFSLLKESI